MPVRLLEQLILLELGPVEDVVDDSRFGDCTRRFISVSLAQPQHERNAPFFKNSSVNLHVLPNFLTPRVMFSFVCESNAGFAMRQLTKMLR